MKKALRNILLITIVLLSVSFIAYKKYWTKESKRIKFLQQRSFRADPAADRYYALDFTPSKLTELSDSVLLLENQQQKQLLLFNTNTGKSIAFSATAKHKLISQINVTNDKVYAADSRSRRITTYDLTGTVTASDSIPFDFSRCVRLQGDSVFLFQRTLTEGSRTRLVFTPANIKTGKIISEEVFASVFPQRDNSDMIYDGFFSEYAGIFYYVCYQESLFFSFDSDLKLRFQSGLIYRTPPPVIRRSGDMKFVESSYIGVSSLSADRHYLLVLSNIGDSRYKGRRIIDVYQSINGHYMYSLVAPENKNNEVPAEIYATERSIYFTYSNGIARTKRTSSH